MIQLKDSISRQLLFHVIIIYLLVTILITFVHVVIDLEEQKNHIHEELSYIVQSTSTSVKNALWELNDKQIDSVVEGILTIPIIKAVQIFDEKNTIIMAKKKNNCKDCLNSDYMVSALLEKKLFDNTITLGSIKIFSNQETAFQRITTSLSLIVIGSLIKSALLIILFIFAFKKYLQSKLQHITTQIETIDLDNPHQTINYKSDKNDELMVLKNSVNKMLSKINEQMHHLKDNEINLQKTIHEQTKNLEITNEQLTQELIKVQQHEAEIVTQKNFLDAMVKNAPIPIFYKDKHGKYQGVNDSWIKMVGYSNEEILQKSVYDIAPTDIANIYAQQDEKVFTLEENPQIYPSIVKNKNNKKTFDVMFFKSAFFDEKGNVAGLIGSILDLTEVNKLQDERLKQERILFEQTKMASMGEMIGNISHQWRQPLSVISTYATGLELHRSMNMLTDELIKESCEKINENAQYLSTTIDDFRSFIKGDESAVEFYIQNVIESFSSLVYPIVKQNNITFITSIQDNIMMQGYPNQLIQCFMNLFYNTNDAFEQQDKFVFIEQQVHKNTLVLTFKDSAGGINEDIIHKIFEPYFTTKHQSQGTGLGLHMTYKLITDGMEGNIEVKNVTYTYNNKELKGAAFTITLPLT